MFKHLHKRALPIALALALTLSGLGGLVVAAEEVTAETIAAEAVAVADIGAFSGSLAGNTDSGSFALYTVAYPGDALLTATVTPVYRDAGQGAAFGVQLYRPDGSAVRHITRADGAYLEVLYTGSAATLVLQVYNYSNDVVSYDLLVDGATAVTPVEPVVATEEPVVEEAVVAEPVAREPVVVEVVPVVETDTPAAEVATELPAGVLATGVLVGEDGGAFVEAAVVSQSADDLLLELQTVPLDPSFGATYGFEVYGDNGHRVAQGVPNETGLFRATFRGDVGETFLVLVYNYAPGQPLPYTLTVTQ